MRSRPSAKRATVEGIDDRIRNTPDWATETGLGVGAEVDRLLVLRGTPNVVTEGIFVSRNRIFQFRKRL